MRSSYHFRPKRRYSKTSFRDLIQFFIFSAIFLLCPLLAQEENPCLQHPASCNQCHDSESPPANEEPQLVGSQSKRPELARPEAACSHFCHECHDLGDTHHPIGVTIDPETVPNMILTLDGTVTCRTCHLITNKRFASESWKAESAFDRLFRKKEKYKTYYLVKQNRSGQLCKSCH